MNRSEKKLVVELELVVPEERAEEAISKLRAALTEVGYPEAVISKKPIKPRPEEIGGTVKVSHLQ